MKVIRSKRLDAVLKDPKAAEQLRKFVASATFGRPSDVEIIVHDTKGQEVRYQPELVRVAGSGT
ncbi:hypothetical protein WJ05_00590 [Burkholderia vietnamiensis]|uniref:hypothetical protein n=1 Tax=Burkholderia vietnamiensis TaxID=60552 RepID=UPI000770BBDE|nr:hypothetical protein [Burkholderia vietnamiensis]KVF11943.1 hypothetical protein WJ05_00590 [Burkholderia vietnamiensis]